MSSNRKSDSLPTPATQEDLASNLSNQNSSGSLDKNWIAEVSHELRLPIANIKLLIETLLDGALEDKETLVRMLKRTSKEVDRLEGLVKDVLSIEQVTNSQQDLNRAPVYLLDSAVYAMESTTDLAKSKSITVKTEIDDEYQIYANQEQLNQVVLNLVENAIKYTSESGIVTIRSSDSQNGLSVQDSGIGIEREEIPKIFNRFYRVDRTKLRGSTGLGLSIVKHIADLHGAKITVHSEIGVGSTFKLEFPQ